MTNAARKLNAEETRIIAAISIDLAKLDKCVVWMTKASKSFDGALRDLADDNNFVCVRESPNRWLLTEKPKLAMTT